MKKCYNPLPLQKAESMFRKEKAEVRFVSTGDRIRAGIMKTLESPLLHTISEDMPEDKVPKMVGRGFSMSKLGLKEEKKEKTE